MVNNRLYIYTIVLPGRKERNKKQFPRLVCQRFGDGSMGHHADVRVIVSGDQHIVRFRDDCLVFDPTKYLELHNDNDPTSHLGIRTMMALSKEAIYINSLGLNNLTLIV